jgi:Putative serine esterase (DUF676)
VGHADQGRCPLGRVRDAVQLFVIPLIISFFLFAGTAHAATCDKPVLPGDGSRTLWYCDTGADTVVVFVHGFDSNNRTAWLQQVANSTRYSYWPQLVFEDDALEVPERSGNKPSIFLAGYYTALDSTIFSFGDASDQLWKALLERLGGARPVLDRHNIMFVAHSAGGIVVRDMLVKHANDFSGKRLGLLLVASPSLGSRYADRMAPAQTLTNNRIVEELQVKSGFLMALDAEFRKAIARGGALGELRGKEIYEHRILGADAEPNSSWLAQLRRAIMESAAASALLERVVERSSAAVYFPDPNLIPESDHSSIAHPTDVNHPSHLALREVYRQMLAARARPCDPPSHFRVVFDIGPRAPGSPERPSRIEAGPLNYELVQLDPSGEPLRSAQTAPDPLTGFQVASVSEPPFACPGDAFWAKLTRILPSSMKMSTAERLTDACFRRSRINSQEVKAFLHCEEGGSCNVDKELPGLAEACPKREIIAGGPLSAGEQDPVAQFWTVPSLATLERQPDAVRPGFTEFTIDSEPIAGVAGATDFSYAVTVNGVAIHMDGLPPHIDRIPFNGKGGVHLAFALENLGFTGGTDGFENIEVELRFYNGKTTLRTAHLERTYVSYRHAELLQVTDNGDPFNWRGYYRPAKVQASYEVMLEHGASDWIRERRTLLDASSKTYDGLPVIGIIRPGRQENPVTGLIVGLRLPSGQARSLFNREEADAICGWIGHAPGFDGLQRKGAYIFQFPPEAFTEMRDRGRKIARCQDIPH